MLDFFELLFPSQGCYANAGGGMDAESGIFTAPAGGTYLFVFHIATHDNKKALLSIRKNGEEVASIFDQNHKDNHKNSMAGQTIILEAARGDEVSEDRRISFTNIEKV